MQGGDPGYTRQLSELENRKAKAISIHRARHLPRLLASLRLILKAD